jgi:hypothetical protein
MAFCIRSIQFILETYQYYAEFIENMLHKFRAREISSYKKLKNHFQS